MWKNAKCGKALNLQNRDEPIGYTVFYGFVSIEGVVQESYLTHISLFSFPAKKMQNVEKCKMWKGLNARKWR